MGSHFDNAAREWDQNPLKVERAQATAAKIKQIDLASHNSIVDFGSGTGLLGVQLIDVFAQVHLVDASSEMLRVAREKIDAANISNITTHHIDRLSELTPGHSVVAALMVLHHIVDVESFFIDAYSVLEDDGVLVIADLYEEDGSFHSSNPAFDGHNGFNIAALSKIAEKFGFRVQSVEPYYEMRRKNEQGKELAYPMFLFVARKC